MRSPRVTIQLPDETRDRLLVSIKGFAREALDLDAGDLKARLILDFFLEELGPSVYNQAIDDAQRRMEAKLEDLGGELHQREPARGRR